MAGFTRRTLLVASTTGIFIILVFAALYLAKSVFIPIAVAFLFNLLLSPFVLRLERLRVPPPLGAAVVLLVALAIAGVAVWSLSGPAADWLARAPETLNEVHAKLESLRRSEEHTSELQPLM